MFRSRRVSVEDRINQTSGPFLEIGGPVRTPGARPMIDLRKISKPLLVSNVQREHVQQRFWYFPLYPGINFYSTKPPTGIKGLIYKAGDSEFVLHNSQLVEHPLDLFADATALPIGRGKLGALYTAALERSAEPDFIGHEAPRTLEPGGVLVAEGVKPLGIAAIPEYFDIVGRTDYKTEGEPRANIVLQRNDVPYVPPQPHAPSAR
jgi:hypothetical protein